MLLCLYISLFLQSVPGLLKGIFVQRKITLNCIELDYNKQKKSFFFFIISLNQFAVT